MNSVFMMLLHVFLTHLIMFQILVPFFPKLPIVFDFSRADLGGREGQKYEIFGGVLTPGFRNGWEKNKISKIPKHLVLKKPKIFAAPMAP